MGTGDAPVSGTDAAVADFPDMDHQDNSPSDRKLPALDLPTLDSPPPLAPRPPGPPAGAPGGASPSRPAPGAPASSFTPGDRSMPDKPQIVTPPDEPGVADVKADLHQLREDFNRLLETVGKTARTGAKGAKGEAEAAAGEAVDWAEDQYMSLRETIRAQPITACAIAAGVGVILGQILLRR